MGGSMYGADAEELERLAQEFRRTADELELEGNLLHRFLGGLSWLGDTATNFLHDWTGVSLPKIGLSTEFLRHAASDLDRQADQQRLVSAKGGAGGSRVRLSSKQEASLKALEKQAREASGRTPAEQTEWWMSLSREDQFLLLHYRPGAVMNLPGLPASARLEALQQYRSDLAARVVVDTDRYEFGFNIAIPNTKLGIGRELSAEIQTRADESVDVVLSGAALISLGVVGASISGSAYQNSTYHFDSYDDARKFLLGLAAVSNGTLFIDYSRFESLLTSAPLIAYLALYGDHLESAGGGLRPAAEAGLGPAGVQAAIDHGASINYDDRTVTISAGLKLSGRVVDPTDLMVSAQQSALLPVGSGGVSIGDQVAGVVDGAVSVTSDLDGRPTSLRLSFDYVTGTTSGLHGLERLEHTTGTGHSTTIELDLSDPSMSEYADEIITIIQRGDGVEVWNKLESIVSPSTLIDHATVINTTYTVDEHGFDLDAVVGAIGGGKYDSTTTSVTIKPPGGAPEKVM